MTFASAKFKSFLPAATFAMAVEFLMGLSDMVVCGHVLGETGLSAVNLMQGVFEIVTFAGMMVAVGTSVKFATEMGALHARRARGYFTLGLISAIVAGIIVAVLLAVARSPVLAAFGASPEVTAMASSYWIYYLPAAFLQPVAFYLGTMCYTDGDAKISFISYLVQLCVNFLLSIPLTMAFGAAGCAAGTGLGALFAIGVLIFHFFKKESMLGFSHHYVITDILQIARTSFGDASKNIGKAVLMFTLNIYVISHFGSEMLPALAVAIMTIGISEIFDGVANAAQPLASVYIGERNSLLTKRIMHAAFITTLFVGFGSMLILIAFPDLMLLLAGVDEPSMITEARLAVRLVSISLVGLAIVLLFNSYYVFIKRVVLSTALTLMAVLVMPLIALFLVGPKFGPHGIWCALGLAPLLAIAVFYTYLGFREGWQNIPLLLPKNRDKALKIFDLVLEPAQVCKAAEDVEIYLKSKGIKSNRASKAALLVEESLMVVRDHNVNKRILAEISIDLEKSLVLTIRDDGEIFDITNADAKISSLRSYLVSSLMMTIPGRRNLTTTGFNKNVFKL